MNKSTEWIQQRVDLSESHYLEWNEVLLVEAAMQCSLERQQRLKIIQFTGLDVFSPVNNPDWLMLMTLQSQERDSFVEFKGVKRQLIRDRHKAEKQKLTSSVQL